MSKPALPKCCKIKSRYLMTHDQTPETLRVRVRGVLVEYLKNM